MDDWENPIWAALQAARGHRPEEDTAPLPHMGDVPGDKLAMKMTQGLLATNPAAALGRTAIMEGGKALWDVYGGHDKLEGAKSAMRDYLFPPSYKTSELRGSYADGGGLSDPVLPIPSMDSIKHALGIAKQMITPPDPYVEAGRMVEQARGGDYLGALETGFGAMPNTGAIVYHGSPNKALKVISSRPEVRQYDNATSQFGAFFAPEEAAAKRYAGDAGRVYKADVDLAKPYEMPVSEFLRFQAPNKGAAGEALDPSLWAARAEELKNEAAALRQYLESQGYTGVHIRGPKGDLREIASFADVPLGITPKNIQAEYDFARDRLEAMSRELWDRPLHRLTPFQRDKLAKKVNSKDFPSIEAAQSALYGPAISHTGESLKGELFQPVDWSSLHSTTRIPIPEEAVNRARDLGYNPDMVLFHGSRKPQVKGFDDRYRRGREQGIFTTDSPDVGSVYAGEGAHESGHVYPLIAAPKKAVAVDWPAYMGDTQYSHDKMSSVIDNARNLGADMLVVNRIDDMGGFQTQYVALRPEILRSPYAKFDPTQKSSTDLTYAAGGVVENALRLARQH